MSIVAQARAVMIRALAVVAVLATYAAGNFGSQIGATVGISSVALTISAAPARAGWRRGWGRRDEGWRGWGWRRGWHRCWWGEWC